jgi:hypothetical protein
MWSRFARTGVLLPLATVVLASALSARPVPNRPRPRALNLFASSALLLEANRVQCGINSVGEVCVAFSGSSVGGGGFWPKGSNNQYIFNSGLQLAAVIDPAATFAWAGDTAGAWFFDPRGDQVSGAPLTSVFSSIDPGDLAAWPNGAVVRDPAIYHPVLLGQNRISDGDAWVRYWEGDPIQLGGRDHPMGIMVEQRALAWNFPTGNEDIIYFVFTFYNVTASDPAAYAGLDPAIQAEVAAVGAQFQTLNEQKFPGLDIPAGGYSLTSMYAAFGMDADVADFGDNYSTAFLPFDIGSTYSGTFLPAVGWTFPSTINSPPFFAGPGFVGVKYLKSPESSPGVEVGLTMFSNTTNGGAFPDAAGDHLLYRRLSGFLGSGDIQCNPFTLPAEARDRRLCYLAQQQADARFYQASGPFTLAPGQAATIVVAYIHAAPVAVTGVTPGNDHPPEIPFTGDSLFDDPSRVRLIDRVAGWVSATDANDDSIIQQDEVTTVDNSLLDKALVAQAVFDAKFLLPNAPIAPQFFLVPGDNQVTVVWQKSETEALGDLFYTIASEPFDTLGNINPLYDPNFRQFDVEGYRIYRGRTSGELQLLAQFDYAGTTFKDFMGALSYGDRNGDGLIQCAPELGLQADCPVPFDTTTPRIAFHEVPLAGQIIQVKPGERAELRGADSVVVTPGGDTVFVARRGTVIPIIADTAVTGGASGFPPLRDNGVAFAYVDNTARNGFTYFYAVTAFDVNSVISGPTSIESPRITKRAVPRRTGANQGTAAGPITARLVDQDGNPISGPAPTINATTGTFTGPAAPTEGLQLLDVSVFAATLIAPNSQAFIQIDSIVPLWYHTATYFVSGLGPVTITSQVGPAGPLGEEEGTAELGPVKTVLPADTTLAKAQGLGAVPLAAEANAMIILSPVTFTSKDADWHPDVDGAFFEATGITDVGGSRWFVGAGETMADPTLGLLHGTLTGVTTIYRPVRVRNASNLFRRYDQLTYHVFRAADIEIHWGATPGTVDSVVDVTHGVPVPFAGQNRASYGFLPDLAGTGGAAPSAPEGVLTYLDFLFGPCVPGAGDVSQANCETRNFAAAAALLPVDINGDLAADGNGFGLYINGEPFIFAAATLPSSTVWTYRSYSGVVAQTGGTYSFTPKPSNPAVPGLRLAIETSTPAVVDLGRAGDLSQVHTVPDPYYVTNALETTANQKVLNFVNLPGRAIVRIYSTSGVLVQVLTHDDPTGGGQLTWNLRNRNNQFVASGVYFYHVEAPDGKQKVDRFTVVNFAP